MGSKQAATLSRLLDTVLSLPELQRAAWIAELGSEFDDLKPRLRSLLARAEQASDLMATLPKLSGHGEAGATHFRASHQAGETVGPYRLLRELGTGAMGVVWLAQRTDGLAPAQVALKFAHVAPARSDLQARLAREHQLLRALDHPNIARLFAADVTPSGQPYLVLEFVPGLPLHDYVAAERPSLARRLELFMQLTSAVAHAHQCQIVHRDLKPANVLVTVNHSVRLLDFGIGKLLAEGVPPQFQLSRSSGQPLTPAYASPEQVLGEPVGLPSDVYSLGVVLYELLTGRRPNAPARGSNLALRTAILEGTPVAPSALYLREATELWAPSRLAALDAIVGKALEKQPGARFPSAVQLATALEQLSQT